MEGGKKSESGSSFTSDLLGSKNSALGSSSGIFNSLFAPPDKVLGRESLRSFQLGKKEDPANHGWSAKAGVPESSAENNAPSNEEQIHRRCKDINSYFQEEKVRPFHYSSSIYYGGQEFYTFPESTQGSGFTTFSKEGEEDDSGSASRGNWWQGSLYY